MRSRGAPISIIPGILLAIAVVLSVSTLVGGTFAAPVLLGEGPAVTAGSQPRLATSVVAYVSIPGGRVSATYVAATGDIYVGSEASDNSVTVISATTDQVVATIPVGAGTMWPLYDSANGELYVSEVPGSYRPTGTVAVIATSSDAIVARIPVGPTPGNPLLDPLNGKLFVPSQFSNSVAVISTGSNRVITNVSVGGAEQGAVFDPSNGDVYVAGIYNLTVISGTNDSVIDTIPVASPSGDQGLGTPAYDPANQEVYVPVGAAGKGSLVAISGATDGVVATIPMPGTPQTPVYDPVTHDLYVADWTFGNLTVVAPANNSVVTNIRVGTEPWVPAYASANRTFYEMTSSGTLNLVSDVTDSVVTNLTLTDGSADAGASPPAYDNETGQVFVAVFAPPSFSGIVVIGVTGGSPSGIAAGAWTAIGFGGVVAGAVLVVVAIDRIGRRRGFAGTESHGYRKDESIR
jgi:YVTN family beta-propeller protein